MIDKITRFVYNPICGSIATEYSDPALTQISFWAFTGQHLTEERYFPMYEDKTLVCKDCGNEFVFTAGEQAFYAERGFQNEPKACKDCRNARKNATRAPREFFTATCARCGGEAKVPFQPKSDRPVFCSECFAQMRANG